jgi:oligopeptidase B
MPKAPIAKVVPEILEIHGHRRTDNYHWLRDDTRENAEVLAYLEAENAYTGAATDGALRDRLFDEIVGRIKKDDSTVPYRMRGYYYSVRYEEGAEYPIYCRREGSPDAAEQILIDANVEAEGHVYYNIGGLAISPDNRMMAYGEDTVSRRIYTLRFRDLETGDNLDEHIEGTSGNAVWTADGKTMFYVKKHVTTLREYQVWRHTLGTPVDHDALVFEETDEEFYVWIDKSKSREYILIGSAQTICDEVRYIPAAAPDTDPVVAIPRERDHEYAIDHAGGRFWIHTNSEARNFRLVSALPGETADRSKWRVEIGARDEVYLSGFTLFDDHLVVSERENALTQLRVVPLADRDAAYTIDQPEAVFVVGIGTNPELDTKVLRFGYTSLTTPASVIDFDMETRERTLRKEQPVLGGFDKSEYETTRVFARAADGAEIPVSLVWRRDLDRSRPQPLLVYGYGAYGLSTDPGFESSRLSLIDRGFIWAIAHIRGGQEKGRPWYEAGRQQHKINSFTDFIAATEHLQAEGWTTPEQTFALGGSAGGLLMGAVVNMRPELYRGVVAWVPFVDVVTTMLDDSIPLTTFEYDEWGNPNVKADYDTMLSYSPYDNVSAQDYPGIFVITGLHDSQVQYWEPAKWVAKLRATRTDDNPLLLFTDMDAGHGGASGRFRKHKTTALMYSWLIETASLDEDAG